MKKYNRVFKESSLEGKNILKFKGVDEIGNFWIVTKPSKLSELEDIFFEADILDIALQVKGGLKGEEIVGFFKNKNKAKEIAENLLKSK